MDGWIGWTDWMDASERPDRRDRSVSIVTSILWGRILRPTNKAPQMMNSLGYIATMAYC